MSFKATKASLPPMPNLPDHPERPPPNIPIPGEPTVGDEEYERKYKCKKCGRAFSNKEELKDHIATNHAPEKEKH